MLIYRQWEPVKITGDTWTIYHWNQLDNYLSKIPFMMFHTTSIFRLRCCPCPIPWVWCFNGSCSLKISPLPTTQPSILPHTPISKFRNLRSTSNLKVTHQTVMVVTSCQFWRAGKHKSKINHNPSKYFSYDLYSKTFATLSTTINTRDTLMTSDTYIWQMWNAPAKIQCAHD